MASLPTVRAARNAMRDRLGEWLATLQFTPLGGGAAYAFEAVRSRPPQPGDAIEMPMAAVVMGKTTIEWRHGAEPVRDSRSPSDGDGVVVNRLGSASAQAMIVVFAASEDQEDEISGALALALAPENSITPRLDLACPNHHGAILTTRLLAVTDVNTADSLEGVWRPAFQVSMEMPLLRGEDAMDLLPQITLDVEDGATVLDLDIDEGTTTDVTDDE